MELAARPALDGAQNQLIAMLENASPAIFVNLPQGWTPARIAEVVRNAKKSPSLERARDGKELLMDWVNDPARPQIEMLRPFYALAAAKASDMGGLTEAPALAFLQVSILHEIAHYWVGVDDDRAERVARAIFLSLRLNRFECLPTESGAGSEGGERGAMMIWIAMGIATDPSLSRISVNTAYAEQRTAEQEMHAYLNVSGNMRLSVQRGASGLTYSCASGEPNCFRIEVERTAGANAAPTFSATARFERTSQGDAAYAAGLQASFPRTYNCEELARPFVLD